MVNFFKKSLINNRINLLLRCKMVMENKVVMENCIEEGFNARIHW